MRDNCPAVLSNLRSLLDAPRNAGREASIPLGVADEVNAEVIDVCTPRPLDDEENNFGGV